ncbi:uncharacterized protein LOC124367750 [Homalodisca vitripennis]|nr:uncharacterized protein LOC124367750 [Homalodisca vitripennis]KAG8277915.1 hypothetical protein J6590_031963 [Homalodisca vitripennis]
MWALLVLCLGLPSALLLELSHQDLELANKTCDGKSTCEHGKNSRFGDDLDWRDRNCFCDELCRRYGDCCLDSPFYNIAEQRRGIASFTCVDLRQFGGIYMMTTCPPAWGNPRVRAMCETGSNNKRDPISGLPATSHNTSITYRNSYCALCHGDTQLELWTPRIECPTLNIQHNLTRENFTNMLVYNHTRNQPSWGINFKDRFHPCTIDPVIPDTSSHIVRRCQADAIKTCAVNWTNNDVRNRCEAYTSMVYHGNYAYRNPHCAMCNNEPLQYLGCSKVALRTFFNKDFSPVAFAVLFDMSGGKTVGKVQPCTKTQLYDPFFRKCRDIISDISVFEELVIPLEEQQEMMEQALFHNRTNHTSYSTEYHHVTESNEEQQCAKFILNPEDYELNNGTVFVPVYDKTFKHGEYTIRDEGTLELCVEALGIQLADKFGEYMGYITFAGLGVSIIFLILHLTAFLLVPELRNLSGKNLASLCISLLVAYTAFMAGQLFKPRTTGCLVVAILTYYSFLASFTWMLTMAFDVWRTLRLATAELRVSAGKQWRKFTIYSMWSWLAPGIIVLSAFLIEKAPENSIPSEYRPDFAINSCWFGQRRALLLYFAVPLGVIMVLNTIFFGSSAHMIYSTTSTTKYTASAGTQRDFRLYIRLALVMGLTWVVGLIAGTLDNEGLWYAFIALNTLQGLFIFLAFTCTDKVIRGLALRRADGRPLRPPSFSWSGASTDSTRKSHIGSEPGTTDTLY